MRAATRSALPLRRLRNGKVREVYEVDRDRLLIVATDRVSAFDVVMQEAIPHKGAVLTQLTAWWLTQLGDTVHHHLLSADVDEITDELPALAPSRQLLAGRSMLCRRTVVFPIECVVRGYLSGSSWKEYRATGTLAGEPLPQGLRESEQLPRPIFSPASKAETGHDSNITLARTAEIVGWDVARALEEASRYVYGWGQRILSGVGLIVADTKFEFGRDRDGRITLIDEVLTPDSSRFWSADGYEAGGPQLSFDKQPLRDYLQRDLDAGCWTGDAPAPRLPPQVVHATSLRYLDAYRRITGSELVITERT